MLFKLEIKYNFDGKTRYLMLLQLKFLLFDMINIFLRTRYDLYKRRGKLSRRVCVSLARF